MIEQPTLFDPEFQRKWPIYSAQKLAGEANKKAEAQYRRDSENWIAENLQNRDIGKAQTPKPTKPLMQIVDDNGVASTAAFPWLVEPELPAVTNQIVNPGAGFFGRDDSKTPPDRTDQLIMIGKMLSDKLDLILKKLGA